MIHGATDEQHRERAMFRIKIGFLAAAVDFAVITLLSVAVLQLYLSD